MSSMIGILRIVGAAEKMTFRILAFGDSLTEGWCNFGQNFHPYTWKLQTLLQSKFTSKSFDVVNKGVSGESTSEMKARLSLVLDKDGPFDVAILLGGTNDLGDDWEKAGEVLFQRLKTLHETALERCQCSVGVTIPETGYENMEDLSFAKKKRLKVNDMLKKYAKDSGSKVLISDLATQLPQYALSDEDRRMYWHDGLHFSSAGYDRMGEIIFEDIKHYFAR